MKCQQINLESNARQSCSVNITIGNWLVDCDSWVADADIRLRHRRVWCFDVLRMIRDLLQVSVRSQDVLMFADSGWRDNRLTVVVGNAGIAHSNDGQNTYELQMKKEWGRDENNLRQYCVTQSNEKFTSFKIFPTQLNCAREAKGSREKMERAHEAWLVSYEFIMNCRRHWQKFMRNIAQQARAKFSFTFKHKLF